MIIKSMSRKTASFSQIIDYMHKEASAKDEQYAFYHNVYPRRTEQIKRDFQANAEHLPNRKNGVYLYHEVISLTRAKNLNPERQKEILNEVVADYLSKRAPDCMGYGIIHDDKAHNIHAHLVISSNIIDSPKRHRLAKSKFDTIKKEAEKRVLEKYPEMEQELAINKKKSKSKVSNKEAELKRRGGRTSQKDKIHEQLSDIFQTAKSKEELFSFLSENGLAMSYRKGYSEPRFGKADSKKHFRLKTLGLDTEYAQLADSLNMEERAPDIDYSGGKGKKDSIKAHYAEKAQKGEMSQDEAKKEAREHSQKTKKRPQQYPWKDDAEKRFKEAQEPSARDVVENTGKEWIAGDFSERDKRILKEKYKKQNEADKKVESHKKQGFVKNRFVEDVKEWFAGDFSARDARAFKKRTDEKLTQPQQKAEQSAKEAWFAEDGKDTQERLDTLKKEGKMDMRDDSHN